MNVVWVLLLRLLSALDLFLNCFINFAEFLWNNFLIVSVSTVLFLVLLYSLFLLHVHRKYDHIPGPKRHGFFSGNIGGITEEVASGGFFANYLLKWAINCVCQRGQVGSRNSKATIMHGRDTQLSLFEEKKRKIMCRLCTMCYLNDCSKKCLIHSILRYGKTFRFNLFHKTMVITADPMAIRDLLVTGHHPKSKMISDTTKTLFGARFLGNSFVTDVDIKRAAWKRSLLHSCFQASYLRNMMSDFNQVADALITRLQYFADGVSPVEMLQEFNKLSLDTLAKTAFGLELDSINESNNPFTKSITMVLKGFTMNNRIPFLMLNPRYWKFIWDTRKACSFLRYFGNELLRKRTEKMKKGEYVPDDILTHIVRIKEKNPELNSEEILDDFMALFIAGQETIASTLSFVLLEVGKNPDVYKKLQKEIDDKVGKKRVLDYSDISHLTYTDMVMKESLRLYPPAANTFREVQTEHVVGGYTLPAYTTVGMCMYVSGRLEEFFPDPLKFDPERFGPDSVSRINSYTYFPFTLGPRTCLGKQFAEIEGKIILAKLFQNFNYTLAPNQSFDIDEVMLLKPEGKSTCIFSIR